MAEFFDRSAMFVQLLPGFILCNYNLGVTGLYGPSKVFAPLVFNFLRNTLSPAETYNILKPAPPKHTFEVWLLDEGAGMIAFTRPS
jgi:hypothetical protein